MTNKKYILYNLNLTTWMLHVVEFIDDSLKMTNAFQHKAFCDYFRQWQNELYTKNKINVKILNQRDKREMIQVQNELRENILWIIHVMIITIINVENFKLYSIFNSNLIFFCIISACSLRLWQFNYNKIFSSFKILSRSFNSNILVLTKYCSHDRSLWNKK